MEFEEEELREFETFVRELIPNISATDYVNFDTGISTFKPMINELEIDTTKRYAKIFYIYILINLWTCTNETEVLNLVKFITIIL